MSDAMSELQAALDEASSPSWARRARAGRDLAAFADVPVAADALAALLLDVADTAVTRQTAEALSRVGTVAALRLVARAVAGAAARAGAGDSHGDWLHTGVRDAVAGSGSGSGSESDVAAVCARLALDADADVRRGAAEILEWV
ncbi:hypothetical protein ACFT9I_14420 [Streptomyces sp. NPDC057137]|uniref:hypothetical protein n=1 Tax=Streptomyces sp. NPDC057137 TaxID=3346030 RepID=UPI00362D22EF